VCEFLTAVELAWGESEAQKIEMDVPHEDASREDSDQFENVGSKIDIVPLLTGTPSLLQDGGHFGGKITSYFGCEIVSLQLTILTWGEEFQTYSDFEST
jgi:hypothetical protein